MVSRYSQYLVRCGCGARTSKQYARAHGGRCKACVTGVVAGSPAGGKLVWWGGKQVRGTRCEDAPCCGCCGPGSDDPAYHESDPYDAYDR